MGRLVDHPDAGTGPCGQIRGPQRLVVSWPSGWQNGGMRPRPRPPDLHRRSCLLAALPWLPVPALAADAPLREAMRRAEALRDEAQRAGDQPYGAVVLHGESLTDAGAPR